MGDRKREIGLRRGRSTQAVFLHVLRDADDSNRHLVPLKGAANRVLIFPEDVCRALADHGMVGKVARNFRRLIASRLPNLIYLLRGNAIVLVVRGGQAAAAQKWNAEGFEVAGRDVIKSKQRTSERRIFAAVDCDVTVVATFEWNFCRNSCLPDSRNLFGMLLEGIEEVPAIGESGIAGVRQVDVDGEQMIWVDANASGFEFDEASQEEARAHEKGKRDGDLA